MSLVGPCIHRSTARWFGYGARSYGGPTVRDGASLDFGRCAVGPGTSPLPMLKDGCIHRMWHPEPEDFHVLPKVTETPEGRCYVCIPFYR